MAIKCGPILNVISAICEYVTHLEKYQNDMVLPRLLIDMSNKSPAAIGLRLTFTILIKNSDYFINP
jgi:hypothetical protein